MTSRYSRLSSPFTNEHHHTSHAQNINEYELRAPDLYQEGRYEPLASQSHVSNDSSPFTGAEEHPSFRMAEIYPETPGSTTAHSSDSHRMGKGTATSVASMPSYHGHVTRINTSHHSATPLRTVLLSWSFELLAVTVNVGALLAIILVLRREDGRPISDWSLAVTLNTVIATLGTLARTTLAFALSACVGQQKWNWLRVRSDHLAAWTRFDEASRGPWGASRLFVWLRFRHWAALGALVIVGSVAFDPFLQAVLTTGGRLDKDSLAEHEARIPQALRIDSGTIIEDASGVRRENTSNGLLTLMGGLHIQQDFGMISAIYNGFHNSTLSDAGIPRNRAEQVVDSVCTTGNCTWAPFTSAAICSSCNDISAQIVKSHGLGAGGSNIPGPNTVTLTLNYTAFTLRNANLSNSDMAEYKPVTSKTGILMTAADTLLTMNATFDASTSMTFQDLSTLIASFTIVKVSDDWIEGKVAWSDSKPTATECALYLCTNMYKAESQNGKLTETLLGSWTNRNSSSYKADSRSSLFDQGEAADAWVSDHGDNLYDRSVPRTDLQMFISEEDSPNVMSFTRTFNISYAFIISMINFLQDFTGNYEQMTYPPMEDGMTPLTNALWESDNLTQTFSNVATSLTNQVRNAAILSPNYHEASGDTMHWVIHVKVKWPYLALPIAMITLGTIYVILTIIESTRLQVPIWKEAALPGLLHGLDDETQSLLREAQSQPTGLEAETTTVRFRSDEKDGCLRLIAERDIVR